MDKGNEQISPKLVNQIFLLLLILVLGLLIFFEMLPYLGGVLGAITIYVLLKKPMENLVSKGWKPNLAAIFLLAVSFIGILIPVTGIILMLGSKMNKVAETLDKVIKASKTELTKLEQLTGYKLTSEIDFSGISRWLSESLQNFAGETFNVVISIFIMYFLLFFMLTKSKGLRASLYAYIPMSDQNLAMIGKDMRTMVRSNAIGIPLVALAQGIVALIGFFIFGIENPFFWFIMVTIGSMIPFVGGLLGILPAFILTYTQGNSFDAWGILLYGILIVGSTDNIIRLFVLKKLDNVHPLITLIGVIVGVPLFGFIGLIFGPLLISMFLILIKIYKKEYHQVDDLNTD